MLSGAVVGHLGLLGVDGHAGVEAHGLGVIPHADVDGVVVVLVGGVLRVVVVAGDVHPVVDGGQRAKHGEALHHVGPCAAEAVEAVASAVAVLIAEVVVVVEFGEPLLAQGLDVAQADAVVPVFHGRGGVLVDELPVAVAAEVLDVGEGVAVALVLLISGLQTEGDVAAVASQAAGEVGVARDVVALAVGEGVVLIAVDGDGEQFGVDGCHGAVGQGIDKHAVEGRVHAVNLVGVVVEGGRAAHAVALALAVGVGGAEGNVGHRVGVPLQAQLRVEAGAAASRARETLAERARAALREEGLGRRARDGVGRGVSGVDVAAHFEASGFALLATVLPREVEAAALGGHQTAAAAHTTTRAEAAVVDVVGRAVGGDARAVGEAGEEELGRVAVFRAHRQVNVRYPRLVQGALGDDVQDGGLLAVVDAGHLGVVALLVISLDFVDNLHGQVFHGRLGVALEEVFAVDEKLGDGFAFPLDGAVVIYLDTRQLLHQGLERRALGHAVG